MTCSVTSNSNSAERSFLTSDRVSRAKREVLEVARTLGAQKGSCSFLRGAGGVLAALSVVAVHRQQPSLDARFNASFVSSV